MKNKINSRSVRMTAVNSRNTTSTSSLATITTTVFTTVNNNYSGKDFRQIIDFSPYVFKGANLSNANFDNLDFENELNKDNGQKLILPNNKSKLDYLDFSGANCTNTSFIETNLTGADFSNSTITGVNFDGADLTGAIFSGLEMTNVSFEQANLTKANFSNTIINLKDDRIGTIYFREANFRDANFSGAKIVNYADFTGGIFKNTNFSNAIIIGYFQAMDNYRYPGDPKTFDNVDFTNAKLDQTNLLDEYNNNEIIFVNVLM